MKKVKNLLNKIFRKNVRNIKAKEVKVAKAAKPKAGKNIKTDKEYFKTARSWADDIYTATIVSRNRYKAAFLVSFGLSILLAFCVLVLVPIQHTELVVVHEGANGYTWLSTTKSHYHPPMSWVREQAEIAHYVTARESYDPLVYKYQTKEVNLLSAPQVQAEYEMAQSSENKASPINILGAKGYRTVVINSILPVDSVKKNTTNTPKKERHVNLAQVNFVVIDHLFGENRTIKTPYTALVSWEYDGVPSSPDKKLMNWDGFRITKYLVQAKNIGNES